MLKHPKTKATKKEMLTREDAIVLVERWRDALHQISMTPEAIKDGFLTEDTVHRILSVMMDEVVVAEGGMGQIPLSVPYRELEKNNEKLQVALKDPVTHVADWIGSLVIGTIPSHAIEKMADYVRRYGNSPAAVTSAEVIDIIEGQLKVAVKALRLIQETATKHISSIAANALEVVDAYSNPTKAICKDCEEEIKWVLTPFGPAPVIHCIGRDGICIKVL